MWTTWYGVAGLRNGASGSADTTSPPSSVTRVGTFIQALAVTMNNVDSVPAIAIGTVVNQCARGESRFQPYR